MIDKTRDTVQGCLRRKGMATWTKESENDRIRTRNKTEHTGVGQTTGSSLLNGDDRVGKKQGGKELYSFKNRQFSRRKFGCRVP